MAAIAERDILQFMGCSVEDVGFRARRRKLPTARTAVTHNGFADDDRIGIQKSATTQPIGPELNPKILYRILHFAAGSRYPSLIPDHVSSDLLEVHPAAHTHNTDAPFH
jgi:hypothetical protein